MGVGDKNLCSLLVFLAVVYILYPGPLADSWIFYSLLQLLGLCSLWWPGICLHLTFLDNIHN